MRPLTAPPRPGAPPLAAPRRPQADAPRHDLRRDPAPTIWAYRMQRVMLTPYLRALLRVGLPSLAVLAAAAIYLSDEARRDGMARIFTDLREKFEQRPEFMVTLASVEGCSIELAEAVRDKLALRLPQSSFDLDLEAARLRIEGLDAVKSADLRVRSGGILEVIVTEREPVAIWRTDDGLTLVDDTGHRVASLLARSDRPDLPLIAGLGADARNARGAGGPCRRRPADPAAARAGPGRQPALGSGA
jgi:cell division protein FtsQ